MKVINSLLIKNMFAHKDTYLTFEDGTNYIVGPIGSGKTEILEAIGFSFFGVTALRDKASEFKNIYVELSFNYKNELFLIKRKINDASLSMYSEDTKTFVEIVNSSSAVNNKIIQMLGYNYDVYILSNFCQQKKLSYFTDLTAAKRLQYIDKINGIEEARNLLKYLTAKRKNLKDQINVLKDVTIAPVISSDIDFNFDYISNIEILSERLNNINVIYTKLNDLNSQIKQLPPKPSTSFLNLDYETYTLDQFDNIFRQLEITESNIRSLENELRSLPKEPKNSSQYDLNLVNSLIYNQKYNQVYLNSSDINVTCSTCNTQHNLQNMLSVPHEHNNVNIKELYQLQDYFEQDTKVKFDNLSKSKQSFEKENQELLNQLPSGVFSKQDYITKCNDFNSKYKKYLEELKHYNSIRSFNTEITQQISQLGEELQKLLTSQAKDIELKDLYIKYNTEKELYLKQQELYLIAKSKLDGFNVELDLVNTLIKEIQTITVNITNQTIPLINHHASYYLNLLTKGRMTSIEITPDYNLIVDGVKINVRSGGETDLASLAYRLSLSQSVIPGMLPLFIADEIDSAGGENDSNDIVEALDIISNKGFQIIMVTHKGTENLENINIIQL